MAIKRTRWPSLTINLVIAVICIGLIGSGIWHFIKLADIQKPAIESEEAPSEPPVESEAKPVATKEELLVEVNRRRSNLGLVSLQYSPELERSAQIKCDDMITNDYFGHEDSNGKQGHQIAFETLGLFGNYSENLFFSSQLDRSAKAIFDGWFDSPPHKEAILNQSYTMTGFGICGELNPKDTKTKTFFVEHFYSPN